MTDDVRLRRKIQQFGSATLAVSLPASWAREHGVEKGDELLFQRDENSGSLLLVPDTPRTNTEGARIRAETVTPTALQRSIIAEYVLGRRIIRVEADDALSADLRAALEESTRTLLGVGIVERSASHVVLRCTVDPSDFQLPALLERLWETEASVRHRSISAVLAGDTDAVAAIDAEHRQGRRLFSLFLRLVYATYRNPRLDETMGIETGFPLLGYRSIAQDVRLMLTRTRRLGALIDSEPIAPEPATRIEQLSGLLTEATAATSVAVVEPTIDHVDTAIQAIDAFDAQTESVRSSLRADRPDGALRLQRLLTTTSHVGDHARDSVTVAGHLAAREQPTTD